MSTLRRVVVLLAFLAVGTSCATAKMTLRISLPPVYEALPIVFADAWGMFEAEGLSLEIHGITENDARNSAFCTGQLDAMMSDLTSAVLTWEMCRSPVIVSSAGCTPQSGSFRLGIVSNEYGAGDIDSLLASRTWMYVLGKTDDQYVLDQFFTAHGEPRASETRYLEGVTYINISSVLALGGRATAALPEPYYSYISTYVQASGVPAPVEVLLDLSEYVLPPRVIMFQRNFVTRHPEELAAFLRVYRAAVERMNATPRDELMAVGVDAAVNLFFPGADTTTIQPQTLDAMVIPVLDVPAPLPRETFDSLIVWMEDKMELPQVPSYESITNFAQLP